MKNNSYIGKLCELNINRTVFAINGQRLAVLLDLYKGDPVIILKVKQGNSQKEYKVLTENGTIGWIIAYKALEFEKVFHLHP